MDFFEELRWRGMLKESTPGVEEAFKEGKITAYIGFDPTAPSMTIGNYVQIMLLTLLQKSGHQPVVLMGCLLYTSPSPRDLSTSRMPSSA